MPFFFEYPTELARHWPWINDRRPFPYPTTTVQTATTDEIQRVEAWARFAGKGRGAVRRVKEDAAEADQPGHCMLPSRLTITVARCDAAT